MEKAVQSPKPPKSPAPPATPTDTTPPQVAADPPGGRYHGLVRVTLQADDGADPKPKVFYSLGVLTTGGKGTRYTAPISIDSSATLQFYAVDRAGNRSPLRSEQYELGGAGKLRSAEALRDRGDLPQALEELGALLAEDSQNGPARALFVEVAVSHSDALVRRDELLPAREVLQRAEKLAGGGPEVARRLTEVEQGIRVEQLLTDAAGAMDGGDYESAYSALGSVLEVDPAHAVARGKLVVVRSALIDRHSKAAMGAYRRQDLEESIRLWDRVLELDPEDETAQLRRAEALHLKQQFQEKFR